MSPTNKTRRIEPLAERLLRLRYVTDSECWEWIGSITKNGYGVTNIGSRSNGQKRTTAYIHRASYELYVGAIPEGRDLDHLCRNRKCFNPKHLEPVTRKENVLRGIGPKIFGALNGTKAHCKNGHPFTSDNTIYRANGKWRRCKMCDQNRSKHRTSPEGWRRVWEGWDKKVRKFTSARIGD